MPPTEGLVLGIPTGAVARRLGVSPTTVRSWEKRYGIAPAARRGGKHRRWSPQDVAMLEEMCRLTTAGVPPAEAARAAMASRLSKTSTPSQQPARPSQPAPAPLPPRRLSAAGSGLPLGAVRPECRGLARAAVRLDGPAVDALLTEVMRDHGPVTAWEEVIAPTLHAVGRKWGTTGERYVEVEHLLSWHVSTALRKAATTPPLHIEGGPVILACTPTEQHTLPLEALAAALAQHGLPMRMFGAAVPADALDASVRRLGPAAVVLWSQSQSTADMPLVRRVAATGFGLRGARTAPVVMLVGPGWPPAAVGMGMTRPRGLRQAIEAISHVYTGESPSRFSA
ncbi:MerR family transcriptional regulator [Streptomyces virginiae]|uniref:MerR family transcriptional regulator n=1 Tax=Streptomyces virginiae TaxID=1961 RepID=UPI002DB921DD|nr:MerR family transcriptional regulator [Streptomyces sp. CMAA1738]MEC4574641.1 MerR family transcriptional regulator [Streptomyces sp. CMAA1738]